MIRRTLRSNGMVRDRLLLRQLYLTPLLVPNDEEIAFVLEILDVVAGPALDKVEALLSTPNWDNVARNDFCRYASCLRDA